MAIQFYFTKHALIEMDNDEISIDDVKKIALEGEVLNVYPYDKKGKSELMFGRSAAANEPVHVVCSRHSETIYIITAYKPGSELWESDYKTRKIFKT